MGHDTLNNRVFKGLGGKKLLGNRRKHELHKLLRRDLILGRFQDTDPGHHHQVSRAIAGEVIITRRKSFTFFLEESEEVIMVHKTDLHLAGKTGGALDIEREWELDSAKIWIGLRRLGG